MLNIFRTVKDRRSKSNVRAYLLGFKSLGTIGLLKYEHGGGEKYQSYAFNSISFILGPGRLTEIGKNATINFHERFEIVKTSKNNPHKVYSSGTTWAITIRGPWGPTWKNCHTAADSGTKL